MDKIIEGLSVSGRLFYLLGRVEYWNTGMME